MSFTVNTAVMSVSFAMVSSPGPVSVTGLKVGDVTIAISFDNTSSPRSPASVIGNGFFEAVVSVDDEIQQLVSTTNPGDVFNAVFLRLG